MQRHPHPLKHCQTTMTLHLGANSASRTRAIAFRRAPRRPPSAPPLPRRSRLYLKTPISASAAVPSTGLSSTLSIDSYSEPKAQLQQLLRQDHPQGVPPTDLPPTPKSATLGDVLPYIAKLALADRQLYWRATAALLALLFSKAAGLIAPWYFKTAVDAMGVAGGVQGSTGMHAAVVALLLSGACRAASSLSKELQHPLFTPLSQVNLMVFIFLFLPIAFFSPCCCWKKATV
jgi:hypothetical protein